MRKTTRAARATAPVTISIHHRRNSRANVFLNMHVQARRALNGILHPDISGGGQTAHEVTDAVVALTRFRAVVDHSQPVLAIAAK